MFDDLLPLSAEAPRCNDFARSLGLRPAGSGLFLRRVILVSVPLPWPKPALKHATLHSAAQHVVASAFPSRLFAAEPFGDSLDVEVYERRGSGAVRYRWSLQSVATIEPLIELIAATEIDGLGSVTVDDASSVELDVDLGPTFLVCTQGSHDTCCGTSGVALADEIEAKRPGYTVRRVSHTGGHRFSPTLLAFPEGRMWAYADLALVDRIAQGSPSSADCDAHSRGWWGAKVGPEQVAEGAVRSALATQPFISPNIVAVESPEGSSRFQVAAGEEHFAIEVEIGRHVPSISCEAPGGLPAKPSREFTWTIERITAKL